MPALNFFRSRLSPKPQPPLAPGSYGYYPTHGLVNPPPPNPFNNQEIPHANRSGYHDPTEVIWVGGVNNIRNQFQECLRHCPHLDQRPESGVGPCSRYCGRNGHCCKHCQISAYPNSCSGTVHLTFSICWHLSTQAIIKFLFLRKSRLALLSHLRLGRQLE